MYNARALQMKHGREHTQDIFYSPLRINLTNAQWDFDLTISAQNICANQEWWDM
jgi:hypothetical protein